MHTLTVQRTLTLLQAGAGSQRVVMATFYNSDYEHTKLPADAELDVDTDQDQNWVTYQLGDSAADIARALSTQKLMVGAHALVCETWNAGLFYAFASMQIRDAVVAAHRAG